MGRITQKRTILTPSARRQQSYGKQQRIARQDQPEQDTGIGKHNQKNAKVAHGLYQNYKINGRRRRLALLGVTAHVRPTLATYNFSREVLCGYRATSPRPL